MRKSIAPTLFALALLASAPAFAMSDKGFLDFAIKGDNSEIVLGNLAGHKGGSAAARSLGDTIEGDHSKARIQAVKLGDWRDIAAPTQPTPEATAEVDKLKDLNGASFDKEFARFLIEDHEKAIAKFKAESSTGEGAVARYAEMSIPVLEKHLHLAEQLAKSANVAAN